MKNFGFVKIATAIPSVRVADCRHNADRIAEMMELAAKRGAAIVLFPEMSITGYTCGDLFAQSVLLDAAREALGTIVSQSKHTDTVAVVGLPLEVNSAIYNCAAVIRAGKIVGIVPKSYLPNYFEFYEARWFAPAAAAGRIGEIELLGQTVPFGSDLLFRAEEVCFGIEICEDLWVPIPPSSAAALNGAELILNLSATDEAVGKYDYIRNLVAQQSARTITAYAYCSAGAGESSTDLVFAGNGIIAENGTIMAETERFSPDERITFCDIDIERLRIERRRRNTFRAEGIELPQARYIATDVPAGDVAHRFDRAVDRAPFVPASDAHRDERCREIFSIQASGLAQRLRHTRSKCAVVGISGGLDSTLALIVTAAAFDRLKLDRKGIIGITMPGFGTTGRTYNNALKLMRELGVTIREIPIRDACLQHFSDIGLDPSARNVTYENSQARERTQILMDVANNEGGMVVGTGDLSELALGWATYNGDHMSMYGVNCGVPKTLVKYLVEWYASQNSETGIAATLRDIINTPISPELLPADENDRIAQMTEDLVGPYELHDFFLYNMVRQGFAPDKIEFLARKAFEGLYDNRTIRHWLSTFVRRFFNQQFKRSALPDGPKVGSVNLSPRGDWRMPSDAESAEWLRSLDRASEKE